MKRCKSGSIKATQGNSQNKNSDNAGQSKKPQKGHGGDKQQRPYVRGSKVN